MRQVTIPIPIEKTLNKFIFYLLTVFNVTFLLVAQNFLRDLFLHHKKVISEAELEEYTSTMVSE